MDFLSPVIPTKLVVVFENKCSQLSLGLPGLAPVLLGFLWFQRSLRKSF